MYVNVYMSKAKNQTQNQKNDTKFLAVVISGMEMEGNEVSS